MSWDDDKEDSSKPSKLHFWGGALSGGATVPFSWATGGNKAAASGIKGALIGGLLGMNGLLGDDDDDSEDR